MAARLLILEPNTAQRILLRAVLSAACHDVTMCETWGDLLRIVPALRPQIVICNATKVPEQGFDTVRRLSGRDTPLTLALTGESIDSRMRAFDDGADDVVSLPFDQTLLLARVRRLMRMRATGQTSAVNFGLREAAAPFSPRRRRVAVVLDRALSGLAGTVCNGPVHTLDEVLGPAFRPEPGDVLVLVTSVSQTQDTLDRLGTLRAALPEVPTVMLLTGPAQDLAARALDMGAADVHVDTGSTEELLTRIARLPLPGTGPARVATEDDLPGRLAGLRFLTDCLSRPGTGILHAPCAVMLVDTGLNLQQTGAGLSAGEAELHEFAATLRTGLDPAARLFRFDASTLLAVVPEAGTAAVRRMVLRMEHVLSEADETFCDTGRITRIGWAISEAQGSDPAQVDRLIETAHNRLAVSSFDAGEAVRQSAAG